MWLAELCRVPEAACWPQQRGQHRCTGAELVCVCVGGGCTHTRSGTPTHVRLLSMFGVRLGVNLLPNVCSLGTTSVAGACRRLSVGLSS